MAHIFLGCHRRVIPLVYTFNAEENRPMLDVNESLWFCCCRVRRGVEAGLIVRASVEGA